MNAGTKDPDCGIDILSIIGIKPMPRACNYGGQKGLRRLDDERKFYRPLRLLQRIEFARDRFARRNTFQKLGADRFLHLRLYALTLTKPHRENRARAIWR